MPDWQPNWSDVRFAHAEATEAVEAGTEKSVLAEVESVWEREEVDLNRSRIDDPDAEVPGKLPGFGVRVLAVADSGQVSLTGASDLAGFNDLLATTPRSSTITVTIAETPVLFTADGRLLVNATRSEATARLLFSGHVPAELATASRWLGPVGARLDALLPERDELLRIVQGMPALEEITPTGTTTTTVPAR